MSVPKRYPFRIGEFIAYVQSIFKIYMDKFTVLSHQYVVQMPISQSNDVPYERPMSVGSNEIHILFPPIAKAFRFLSDN